jgi:integrase/recombinase XerD
MSKYLEEEEVKKLIEATPTVQKKAFLSCLYESGARPEEFLKLSNLETKIDSKGVVLILRGKTGERRVRIIAFTKLACYCRSEQFRKKHVIKGHTDMV